MLGLWPLMCVCGCACVCVCVGAVIEGAWQPPAVLVDTLSPRLSSKFMGSPAQRPEMTVFVRRGFWQLPFYFADWQQFFTLSPSHVSTHIIFICISRVPLTHLHGHAYVYSYADVCIARESEYIYLCVLESMTDLRPSRIVLGKLPFFSNFYD